jgi:hypothetical protein
MFMGNDPAAGQALVQMIQSPALYDQMLQAASPALVNALYALGEAAPMAQGPARE